MALVANKELFNGKDMRSITGAGCVCKRELNSESCVQKRQRPKDQSPLLPVVSMQLMFSPFLSGRALFHIVSQGRGYHLSSYILLPNVRAASLLVVQQEMDALLITLGNISN